MRFLMLVAAMLAAQPALAQRAAVSAQLSPEQAGSAFASALTEVCLPAAAGAGVSALTAAREGRLHPTQDAGTRRQANAAADETVWDVAAALGVVTVRERAGRCVVSVYGPPAMQTVMSAMSALSGLGFEPLAGPAAPGGFVQTLVGASGGVRTIVQLAGAEPGAAGNQSRFSVVTATVSIAR